MAVNTRQLDEYLAKLLNPNSKGAKQMASLNNELSVKKLKFLKFKDCTIATAAKGVTALQLPEGMSLDEAAHWINVKRKELEQTVKIHEKIEGFPVDVAYALQQASLALFGVRELKSIPGGFFAPDKPPAFMRIETDAYGNSEEIFIGRFGLPGMEDGYLQTYPEDNSALYVVGEMRAKHKPQLAALIKATKDYLSKHSIYKGKAFSVTAKEVQDPYSGNEYTMFDAKFMRVDDIPATLMLNAESMSKVEANVWTPIRRTADCRELGIPVRRGILLSGPFGTGKSLCAQTTAKYALDNGWTFIYCKDIKRLQDMYTFAARYSPAVLFAEDFDAHDKGQLNQLQNVLDGVDTKNAEIMLVMTTNYIERVPQVLLRPGRLDTVIFFDLPNAETAARLVEQFGAGMIDKADFNPRLVGAALEGQIPAVIREVLESAKLYALNRGVPKGQLALTTSDICEAADGMKRHLAYLNRPVEKSPSVMEAFGSSFGDAAAKGIERAIVAGISDVVNMGGNKLFQDRTEVQTEYLQAGQLPPGPVEANNIVNTRKKKALR